MPWRHSRTSSEGELCQQPSHNNNRLPMLSLRDQFRNNLTAVIGEFVGTFLFLFFSFVGTQVANTPKPTPGSPPNLDGLLFSSLCFGFSLTVNVWAFYRVTGGLFNPAVSGPLHWTRLPLVPINVDGVVVSRLLWLYAWLVACRFSAESWSLFPRCWADSVLQQ